MTIDELNDLLNVKCEAITEAYKQQKYVRHTSTGLIGQINTLTLNYPYSLIHVINSFAEIKLMANGYITANVADIEILEV
jgi:hypothetical protein